MTWITKAPDNFTGTCLVTMKVGDRRWVTEGWADKKENGELVMTPGAIAWMPMPEHAAKNPAGWLSHYRGDDFPKTEDWYLVSTMHEIRHYGDLPYGVEKLWFDSKKEVFGGNDNFIAWMSLPKPFEVKRKG
jgi:hypothetical protein